MVRSVVDGGPVPPLAHAARRASAVAIHADRFEIYGYPLPDDGRLVRHLATAGPQQFDEYDWFVGRLREAVEAWRGLAGRAAIVVLREVIGGLVIIALTGLLLRLTPRFREYDALDPVP